MIINQSRDNSFAIINTDIHTGIVKTQSRLFLSLKVLNAPIFTISTRGRVTQASLSSLLSSKISSDCRFAFYLRRICCDYMI